MVVVKRTNSITRIENLSNEILYDIFDYLDGYDLYQAFVNINQRFQSLLYNPYLLLKINLKSNHEFILEYNCINIIKQNKSHILSLTISNSIASKCFRRFIIIDSLFYQLQSFSINDIPGDKLQRLLVQLNSLPQLYSLNIVIAGYLESSDHIYQSIFRLRVLKYYKLSYGLSRIPVNLPLARIEQFASIEYLNIDIDIELHEFISVLSYTPKLRRLTCRRLFNSLLFMPIECQFKWPNLTHVYLDQCHLGFHEFEMLIKIISSSSSLQVLRLMTLENTEFLDGNRWEAFILQYLSQLNKFELVYEEKVTNHFQMNQYHLQIKQFLTSFWIERQWYFHLQIDASSPFYQRIIYSIHPSKKKWYHLSEDKVDSSTSNCRDIELHVKNRCDFEQCRSFLTNIEFIFTIVRITYLNIDLSHSSINLLLDFVKYLPHLNSLNLSCLPVSELNISIDETSRKNKITKVNLEKMVAFEQVQFLMNLCSYVEYLQVKCTDNFNFNIFKRFILMKKYSKKILKLNCLCLHIPTADEDMIEDFQIRFNLEKLPVDYSIEYVIDKFYIQWK